MLSHLHRTEMLPGVQMEPSVVQFVLTASCSSPLIIYVGLQWIPSNMSMCLMYRGVQNYTQYSTCGLASAEYRGKITSFSLLAILCPAQGNVTLLCGKGTLLADVQLGVSQHMQFFFCQATSSWVALASADTWVVLLQVQDLALFVELREIFVRPPFQSVKVLWVAARFSGVSATPQFCMVWKHAEGMLCPVIQFINETAKQDWNQC